MKIEPPQGELLPAEERLQNVLKAIEDRLLNGQKTLHNLEDLYDLNMGHTDEEEVNNQRAFMQGLDIAWSIAKTESLRRQLEED